MSKRRTTTNLGKRLPEEEKQEEKRRNWNALTPAERGRGRPPVNVDPERVRNLAAAGVPVLEIAATLHISHETLYARYRAELDDGRLQGDALIRRKAFEMAINHNDWGALKYLLDNRLHMNAKSPIQPQVNVQTTMQELASMSTEELNERLNKIQQMREQLEALNGEPTEKTLD